MVGGMRYWTVEILVIRTVELGVLGLVVLVVEILEGWVDYKIRRSETSLYQKDRIS